MKIQTGNLFQNIPAQIEREIFETLFEKPGLGIRRVLSQGQVTGWMKQDEDEWVILLAGAAKILVEEGNREIALQAGDYLLIPAGCRHRVAWTDPVQKSVWLAVHYKQG